MRRALLRVALVVGALALACCSDGDKDGDQGVTVPDGSVADLGELWPCEEPGKPCNAHNPCAIDPVCGADKLCRPTSMQDCDDGLECTDDICAGMGLCENRPRAGACALPVPGSAGTDAGAPDAGSGKTVIQCFKDEEAKPGDPCMICDPDDDPTQWSAANGGACDDGDACTKDDYCQAGVCKGVYYGTQCADDYGCTDDVCDGKGGCLGNDLRSDWCLINGTCVMDGAADATGCQVCDVSVSQSDWTLLTNVCVISGMCYKPGDKSQNGCGECKPSVDPNDWTPLPNTCLISGTCYKPGDKSQSGCGECDPTQSATDWSPISNTCLISGTCYKDGDPHPQGCAKCDSAASGTSWTVTDSTKCVVSDSCVDKATSPLACGACGVACGPGETCSGGQCSCGSLTGTVGGGAVCAAAQSCDQGQCVNLPPGTLVAPLTLDFELSDGALAGTKDWEWGKLGNWNPSSSCDGSETPPTAGHSGMGAWGTKISDCYSPLGNASSTCNNSDTTDDSVLSFKVKIPGNWTKATLSFYEWYDLFLTFDWSEIRVDGTVATQTCTGSAPSPPGWSQRTVDLSAYAGKIIEVAFHMMATSVVNYAGWYIDDLSISGS